MSQRFEEIEHTADVAIRVWGSDLAELFANAAYGMACQLADPGEAEQAIAQSVELDAFDVETLLVSWLGELLYLGEREECVFTDFDVIEITTTRLQATIRGRSIHEHRRHIKAVTFSDLEIVRTGKGYETVVVFDV
jgi:SHS2 domain-containing protein